MCLALSSYLPQRLLLTAGSEDESASGLLGRLELDQEVGNTTLKNSSVKHFIWKCVDKREVVLAA